MPVPGLHSLNLARFLPRMFKSDTTPHISETHKVKPHCIRHPDRHPHVLLKATAHLGDGGPGITVMKFYLCAECADRGIVEATRKIIPPPPPEILEPLNPDFPPSAIVPEYPYGQPAEKGEEEWDPHHDS